jgi:hypothetical protein
MGFKRWEAYAAALHGEFDRQSPGNDSEFFRLYGRFREFVAELTKNDRIPLLIHAYQQYQECGSLDASERDSYFWHSAYSILISALFGAGLTPNEAEACAILRSAFHYCGHGDDVMPPIELAEKAFRNRPYSGELFDAARVYRERLGSLAAVRVQAARRRLDLLLWHDVTRPLRGCWTSRIQLAISAMSAQEALRWHLLLRNVSPGLWKSGQGKGWSEEAHRRLADLGGDTFLHRLDQWFVFGEQESIRLSVAGGDILRLLILYAGLVRQDRGLPILTRLTRVRWNERMQKVVRGVSPDNSTLRNAPQ